MIEQLVEQQDPQENDDSTLRRSITERKLTIPSNYVVYLQEADFNIEPLMILKLFHKPWVAKNQIYGQMP